MADPAAEASPSAFKPDPEYFTAEPNAARARFLHVAFRRMMLEQLLGELDSAAEGLKVDLGHIRRRFAELDPEQGVSPALYTAMTELGEALSSGQITSVMDALQVIRITPDDRFFDTRFRIDSVLTESWERNFINQVRASKVEGSGENAHILRPILDQDPAQRFVAAQEALQALRKADPDMAAEFDELVTRVKLFIGHGYLGFSSPAAFGAIFMRLPDADPIDYFIEHLVHETSHLSLNTLMVHDPLLENPSKAPLRDDPRPLYQILHATFVLGRNVRVGRRVVAELPALDHEARLAGFEAKFAEGLAVVEREARLTELGRRLVDSFPDVEP